MQLKEVERFEEEMVELVVEGVEMAAQHLVEEEDLIEEEQVLWEEEEDLIEEEQMLWDEEDLIEEEQVLWLTDYEDLIYLVGGSAFHTMEAEVLRLVEEAIQQIAEEWEGD